MDQTLQSNIRGITDIVERFASQVEVEWLTGCWKWLGGINSRGYGVFGQNGYAHRFAYRIVNGGIPHTLELDHLCFNTLCCNPNHLETVTHEENMRRVAARRTYCINGHKFTPENTHWRGNGRVCRTCRNINSGKRIVTRAQQDRRNELQQIRREEKREK